MTTIRQLTAPAEGDIAGLVDVLVDVVRGGASVGFMASLTASSAQEFWRRVAGQVTAGDRALLVAEDEAGIVGTVQLVLRQPDNQPHRADLAKMLVHRRARRQGLAGRLLRAAEDVAREHGRTLLVLDTVTGGDAERLYRRAGWQYCGVIPGYALMPDGTLCDTTVFYRRLAAG